MPTSLDGPALLRIWMELNAAAQQAETLVAHEALDNTQGMGIGPSPELRALATDLRALSNKYRDLALGRDSAVIGFTPRSA